MKFQRHHDFGEIGAQHWNDLVEKSITDVPFLQFGYLNNWWVFRGGGEWSHDAILEIFSAQDKDGLVGLAPLFRIERDGTETLYFVGSIEISDYLDFIVSENHLSSFMDEWFSFLEKELPQTQKMMLVNIPERSPSLKALEKNAKVHSWEIRIEKANHTPVIHLAHDWESYLMSVDKKQRHEIRRKLRSANQESDTLKWYYVSDPEKLHDEFEAFLDMMAQNPNKKEFLEGSMRNQMHAIVKWAFERDMLQLSFLTIDGQKASSYLCFDYKDRIYVYNSGYDIHFASYSPGWVHLGYLIQNAIENRKKDFDFLRGNETYKYRFGAEDSLVMKAILTKKES